MAIALERFIGICRAQYGGNVFVVRKARYYVLGILLITIIVDAVRFFELTPTYDINGSLNGFDYTKLRKNQTYVKVYTLWFRLVMTAAIPFVLMVFLNLKIMLYFKRNR